MWNLVAGLASSASGILALLAVVAGLLGLGAFELHGSFPRYFPKPEGEQQ